MNYNKIKKVASILLVFFIVLSTNLVDKENFNRLRKSVTTIYEDRVVASDLLFEIALLVHEKEIAMITSDSLYFQKRSHKIDMEIDGYITRYEQTKLTDKELALFNDLKKQLDHLNKIEKVYNQSTHQKETLQLIESITLNLQNLSKVQLDEGKHQMFISNKVMKTIDIFTHIEIIFLVVMAILVQIIIFYNPKKSDK
ncbi:chemotaxis protein [Wenyingzhuangia fucanilytica]|uniref:Chemotaxis protein n=1 Tax=Wenyingzhuangia fucanilytica TaxID=1790137 RepID=A0A1B1Y4N0_9FLAO|nr:MCP four helix bundle domain-containing protein [Wenyingzhuangia fucanilytica]ANW95698.1 chemotaxis protein [Wenyingzhuangia fucanilytica]